MIFVVFGLSDLAEPRLVSRCEESRNRGACPPHLLSAPILWPLSKSYGDYGTTNSKVLFINVFVTTRQLRTVEAAKRCTQRPCPHRRQRRSAFVFYRFVLFLSTSISCFISEVIVHWRGLRNDRAVPDKKAL